MPRNANKRKFLKKNDSKVFWVSKIFLNIFETEKKSQIIDLFKSIFVLFLARFSAYVLIMAHGRKILTAPKFKNLHQIKV